MRNAFIISAILGIVFLGGLGFVSNFFWWVLAFISPLILLGVYDMLQTHHAIRRNFPILGNMRYLLESIRPEISQYFIETDLNGRPFNRRHRSIVYQRAKGVRQTVPFGTQLDTKEPGYEWISHSIYPTHLNEEKLRFTIGGPDCKQPYNSSIINISAMSFGSLSKNAIMALNGGAKLDHFAHNTGEGGLSPYHLKPGGDLIWQIGTGYFGCRNEHGNFSEELFKEKVAHEQVKMVEIKISQGAKPGHGGILPAAKNTEEIAKIRHVKPFTDVISPPGHSAFSDAESMMHFIKKLRELSNGKPIGFKLCIGSKHEFTELCIAMKESGIKPDFITIDGNEGGTGAAPLEFSDHLGTPLYEGLSFAYDELTKYGLKKDVKLIASGRLINAFEYVKALALGADGCNSARGMMMALGCIQALRCDSGKCPAGVATQDRGLMKGLEVEDKKERVANFHKGTIEAIKEILEACGVKDPTELNRSHINRRVEMNKVMTFAEIYPYTSNFSHEKAEDFA